MINTKVKNATSSTLPSMAKLSVNRMVKKKFALVKKILTIVYQTWQKLKIKDCVLMMTIMMM